MDCIIQLCFVILNIIYLLSWGVDAFEGMFGISDTYEYQFSEPSISEIQVEEKEFYSKKW